MGQLCIGASYHTRNGLVATVMRDNGDAMYPYYAEVIASDGRRDRLAYYTPSGQYRIGEKSGYDLISPVGGTQ